jgi:GTP cyclohydrolase IA
MQKLVLTMDNVSSLVARLAVALLDRRDPDFRIYGIPRGGIAVAYALQAALSQIYSEGHYTVVSNVEDANVVVDDLMDSGDTMARYQNKLYMQSRDDMIFAVLGMKSVADTKTFSRPALRYEVVSPEVFPDMWIVFPWEVSDAGHDVSAEDSVTRMLQAIGEDPTRQGLLETPKRVVKAWGEWFSGYKQNPVNLFKTFEDGAEGLDEMILLTDIPVFSHCEHHITPFIGTAHVAYIPNGKIVGLSKLVKVVDMFSRRLQVQERLTRQIADCIEEQLNPLGVAVVVQAKHFCMCTRGVKSPNTNTTTIAVRGAFKTNPETRAEYMARLPKP